MVDHKLYVSYGTRLGSYGIVTVLQKVPAEYDHARYRDNTVELLNWLLGGALIGGLIGYFIVGVDALRDRSLVRFSRLATYGVLLGAAGGAAGMVVANLIHALLIPTPGDTSNVRSPRA